MNKYLTYSLIGRILALDVVPAHRGLIISGLQRDDIRWERFVALADYHLVLQALYPKIRDHGLLEYFPAELLDHLKYIFDLTTARNLEIIRQTEKLTAVLKKEEIIPLYMKGVGNILDGLYKYPGERILHDIDILVPEERFENTVEILFRDGYQCNYKYDPLKKSRLKHYPLIFKPGEPVCVEVHRMLVEKKYSGFLRAERVLAAGKAPVSYPDCLVMSDEHNIVHNFLHAQFDHRARIYARELMRNLYDLLLLSGRKDPEEVFFDLGHFRRTSSGYLDITYFTFDIIPAQRKTPVLFLHTYRFRYYLNLRYRFVEMTFFFLKRIFSDYVGKILRTLPDKKLRRKLFNDLRNPAWYKKEARYYRKIFGIRNKD